MNTRQWTKTLLISLPPRPNSNRKENKKQIEKKYKLQTSRTQDT